MLHFLLNTVFLTGCSKFKFCSSKKGMKNDGTAHFKDLVNNVHLISSSMGNWSKISADQMAAAIKPTLSRK